MSEYIHVWYVNATDPWDPVMYDVVVNQMSENTLAKKALCKQYNYLKKKTVVSST